MKYGFKRDVLSSRPRQIESCFSHGHTVQARTVCTKSLQSQIPNPTFAPTLSWSMQDEFIDLSCSPRTRNLCCGSSTTSDRSRTILGFENEKSVRSTLWRSQSHLERRGLNGCCATTQGRYRGMILTRSTSLRRDSSGSCGRIQLLDAHHRG